MTLDLLLQNNNRGGYNVGDTFPDPSEEERWQYRMVCVNFFAPVNYKLLYTVPCVYTLKNSKLRKAGEPDGAEYSQ